LLCTGWSLVYSWVMQTDPIGISINEPFSLVSKQEGVLDDITLKMMPTHFEIGRLRGQGHKMTV